jgi:hypothetical protein
VAGGAGSHYNKGLVHKSRMLSPVIPRQLRIVGMALTATSDSTMKMVIFRYFSLQKATEFF